ncbi:uncharacterized protein LOC111392259 [Olea europaea var. sylvestris]|uniref:uncharacterized protein LOC111392259 n=1 Tax=Olea europaea var. sylvestris TaxID=158386 RepID=UPI000C1D1658|nr:uncharacterized protein LOC111392259 [Olea europaea var. sylvestris]
MSVTTFTERVKRYGLGETLLKKTNIGTTALVEGYAGEFRRRVIGVDGCFFKTKLGSQLLTAVGVDANNGMYLVAYAVVEVENEDNWRWFLGLLKDDLHIHNTQYWTFISDKQKGLTNTVESFENLEHRTCVRHLYNNFSLSHKGLALKNCLWDATRATTVSHWLEHMQHITIVTAREKPILTMLEDIRVYLMRRIVARRESCDRWTTVVGPRIQKILEKNSKPARIEWAEYAGNEKFQVRHDARTVLYAMDLKARTCTCRDWQLSRIACSHVIASVVSKGLNVMEFMDDIYKNDAYMRTYTPSISPITGPNAWPTPSLNPLNPPVYTKRARRPKKNSRK